MDFEDVFAYSATVLIIAVIVLIIMTIIFLINGNNFIDSLMYASVVSTVVSIFVIVSLISS